MLCFRDYDCCVSLLFPLQLEQALSWVQDTSVFEFVGLTDYWRESICLFHAMFGGNITKHELDNVRCVALRLQRASSL